ncbi:hypothetical protein M430DRAFT_59389 [Amorphotheca resinae ATCC 22711]|uniref:Uncharacterized protein n=1 Tax=Amorphotheca resinae ATCC 22711 TaxID=857342 RepID=A0A2T3B0T0_AMORE|nr:hypothetical protein M430DRAFT_59389 [Amorphotheca resinae ATCC 22711]PSS17007.1 hypothetical protein M430DRAFT_59389 [Amorphotheca resinae ATCC 22711]
MGNQLSIPQFLIPEVSSSQLSNIVLLQLVPSMSQLPPTPPMSGGSLDVVQTPETSHEEDSQLPPNSNNNNNNEQKKEPKKLETPSKAQKQKLPISRHGQRMKMLQVTTSPQLPVENKISNNNNNINNDNNNDDDDNNKHPAVDDLSTDEPPPDAKASSTSTTFEPDLEGLSQYNKQMQELYGKELEALTKAQKRRYPISKKGKLMKLSHVTMKTGHENAGGKFKDLEVVVFAERVVNLES